MSTKVQNKALAEEIIGVKNIDITKVIEELKVVIEIHEKFQGKSWFYTPYSSADSRRNWEEKYSEYAEIPLENGGTFNVETEPSMSCRNVYYRTKIWLENSEIPIANLNIGTVKKVVSYLENYLELLAKNGNAEEEGVTSEIAC